MYACGQRDQSAGYRSSAYVPAFLRGRGAGPARGLAPAGTAGPGGRLGRRAASAELAARAGHPVLRVIAGGRAPPQEARLTVASEGERGGRAGAGPERPGAGAGRAGRIFR